MAFRSPRPGFLPPALGFLFFLGCAGSPLPRSEAGVDGIPVAGYRLVFADEFDGEGLDPNRWRNHLPGLRRSAVNVAEAVQTDGKGHLVLTTFFRNGTFFTGMISTRGLFERAFGYYECRVRLQRRIGHWSAFWLQTPTMGNPLGDPGRAGAEIDVFEYLRREGNRVHHTLHWDGYGASHRSEGKLVTVPGLSEGWHRFGLLWTEDRYVFYVDGEATWQSRNGVSRRPQYMILSLEVGPWAGRARRGDFPDSLLVDYVRVYAPGNPNDPPLP